MQGYSGEMEIDLPRDRQGSFEPLLVAKWQKRMPGFDEKIIALYARGMTVRDIQALHKARPPRCLYRRTS